MFIFTHMSVINIHINVAFTLFSKTLIVNLEKLRRQIYIFKGRLYVALHYNVDYVSLSVSNLNLCSFNTLSRSTFFGVLR